jgi:Lar family restriction alleviation protein
MTTELLPCPFCGLSNATIKTAKRFQDRIRLIRCNECGAQGPENWAFVDPVSRWNRRTPPPAAPEIKKEGEGDDEGRDYLSDCPD